MAGTETLYLSKNIRYLGTKPKNDQSNPCRELLGDIVDDFGGFYEIFPEKYYFITLAQGKRLIDFNEKTKTYEKCPFIFWFFEEDNYFLYENFNMDFGPYNLGVSHLFCSRIKVWLDTRHLRDPDKYIAIVIDDLDLEKKLNVKLLVAISAMVLMNMTDQQIIERLNFFMLHKTKESELVFRDMKKFSDVSGFKTAVTITLDDCVQGFYAAFKLKWYDFYEFDHAEYLFYETVQSGDFNWIIPGKLLAFAGPNQGFADVNLCNKHSPTFYYHYFKHYNVTTIIRLNKPEYSSNDFTEVGFEHYDLIFPDGYPPSSTIAAKFFKIVEQAKGAVAVHCFAGIGRTGTLIAAYIMAKYNFTPQMAIAWTRICRPGSVIADQQDWLSFRFDPYSLCMTPLKTPVKNKKTKSQTTTTSTNIIDNQTNDSSKKALSGDELETKIEVDPSQKQNDEDQQPTQSESISYEAAEKKYGQATALLMAKKKREKQSVVTKPCTRNVSSVMKKAAQEDAEQQAAITARKRSDLILDLGKTLPCDVVSYPEDLEKEEFYHIKDYQYEWKVKFPKPSYVSLKYYWSEGKRINVSEEDDSYGKAFRGLSGAPKFKHEVDGYSLVDRAIPNKNEKSNSVKFSMKISKRKPIVYYT